MKGFKELERAYDVVIVGGGMTGLCAAIASARNGAKTALVQDRSVLGGNASSEIRMHIHGAAAAGKKPDLTESGILHEIQLENKRVNDSHNFSIWDAVLFSAAKKEENLTLYLNLAINDVECEDGRVVRVSGYQSTTERQIALRADIFIDCTGNGTISTFAGAVVRTGSEGKAEFGEPHAPDAPDSFRMGNTLLFKAANVGHPVKFIPPVDAIHFTEEQLRFRQHSPEVSEAIANTATQNDMHMMFSGFCLDYGYWWIEVPGESDDIIGEYEDIRDTLVRVIYGVWDHIKNGGNHGADNYELAWVGMLPGIRESRRIEGDYMLTEVDILENRVFEDAVAYGGWDVDNHAPKGLFDFDRLPSDCWPFPGAYTIPYRSYLVKGFKNLMVAGRCLSASKLAMASTRVMGTCSVGGQAVGTAAALCVRNRCDIRALDINELQQTLLKQDAYIPGYVNADPLDFARAATVTASSEQSGFEAAQVVSGVSRPVDGVSNQWRAQGAEGEWISLKLAKNAQIGEVRLTFDSDFSHEKRITLASRGQGQQVVGVPPELVRDFTVSLKKDGNVVSEKQVRGNYQRLCVVKVDPALCDEITVTVESTNGIREARIFEIRAY